MALQLANLTESITAADSSVVVKIFNSAITEAFTTANTQNATTSFVSAISESLNLADSIAVIASFSSQIAENLVLLDTAVQRGWIVINDSQTVTWVPVYNNYP
jgi:hypothetical protein